MLVFFLFAAVSSVWAFDPDYLNSVTIENRTGKEIWYLYVSPGDSEVWGPDLLDSTSTLENRETHKFMILYPDATNNFDIMLVAEDGSTFVKWDVPVTDGTPAKVVFTASDASAKTEQALVKVTITNDTGFEIYYLFFSPEDSSMWGPDILRSDVTLETGTSYSFYVPVNATETYNMMAVDEDNDTYSYDITLRPGRNTTRTITLDDLD